jgi:hypothetical protein
MAGPEISPAGPVTQGPANTKMRSTHWKSGMIERRGQHLFIFLMLIIGFLSDYRKKSARKRIISCGKSR